jgi:hypothetical protein
LLRLLLLRPPMLHLRPHSLPSPRPLLLACQLFLKPHSPCLTGCCWVLQLLLLLHLQLLGRCRAVLQAVHQGRLASCSRAALLRLQPSAATKHGKVCAAIADAEQLCTITGQLPAQLLLHTPGPLQLLLQHADMSS